MALDMVRTIHLHDAEKNLVTTLTIEEHLASDNLLDEENPENEILTILSQVHDENPPLRAPILNIERNHPAAQALILLVETINKNGFLTFVLNPGETSETKRKLREAGDIQTKSTLLSSHVLLLLRRIEYGLP